jgi:farnesyl-diphosphate farnesyltransferase
LLARASDTIADTNHADLSVRVDALKLLQAVANGDGGWDSVLGAHLARFQKRLSERQLLERLSMLVRELETHSDTTEIRSVWITILKGQIFDLEHCFSQPLSADELDHYTFWVAGSVGQFWTQLCQKKIPKFSSLSYQQMEHLGILYGKGLQLINILRDREEDALRGRVYICPAGAKERIQEAFRAMRAGMEYAVAINPPVLRYTTLLPALIGIQTLKLISTKPGKVKVSRTTVYRQMIFGLSCFWTARRGLR